MKKNIKKILRINIERIKNVNKRDKIVQYWRIIKYRQKIKSIDTKNKITM